MRARNIKSLAVLDGALGLQFGLVALTARPARGGEPGCRHAEGAHERDTRGRAARAHGPPPLGLALRGRVPIAGDVVLGAHHAWR
jgi:hypothetical protein